MSDGFTLRFTDIDPKTGLEFMVYETKNHGWKSKEHFLKSVKDKGQKILNGYKYYRCENEVLTEVEAI